MQNFKDGVPPEQNVEQLFPWYQSTGGPGLSMTLTNEALTLLPVANLVLANVGINLLPGQINLGITLAVFLFFAGRAAYGYVMAKKVLGEKLLVAQSQLASLKHQMAASSSR